MSTKVKVRSDEIGLYVKHGDRRVRPIVTAGNFHYGGENNPFRRYLEDARDAKVAWDGTSDLNEGDSVYKTHIRTTVYFLLKSNDGETREIWFVHSKERP